MMQHFTLWEDAEMAGVQCGNTVIDQMLHADEPPVPCGVCGALIRLRWNVAIEEVEEPTP